LKNGRAGGVFQRAAKLPTALLGLWMYTAAGLTDLHSRAHRSLQKLLDHCAGFSTGELNLRISPGRRTRS